MRDLEYDQPVIDFFSGEFRGKGRPKGTTDTLRELIKEGAKLYKEYLPSVAAMSIYENILGPGGRPRNERHERNREILMERYDELKRGKKPPTSNFEDWARVFIFGCADYYDRTDEAKSKRLNGIKKSGR